MIEASVTIPKPIINATTGLAWWTGTSSTTLSRMADGIGDERLEVDARVVDEEFMTSAL